MFKAKNQAENKEKEKKKKGFMVRDVNVFFFLKNDRFVIKRRQKIKNETIGFYKFVF